MPTSPGAFLKTRLLSLRAKLRLLFEPFAGGPPEGDESIHDFAARRIGSEAASVMVGSMVSGIFAGDAKALSLKACFPKMWELERQYGSLVRALFATRKNRTKDDAAGAPAGRLTSFTEEIRRRGMLPESQTLLARVEQAGPGVARALDISPGDPVLHWRRLRRADQAIVCVEDAYLNEVLLPGFLQHGTPTSLYEALAARGLRPTEVEDSISADRASADSTMEISPLTAWNE